MWYAGIYYAYQRIMYKVWWDSTPGKNKVVNNKKLHMYITNQIDTSKQSPGRPIILNLLF